MVHEGRRLVTVCFTVCFRLLNDPVCEKCSSSHRLHMCTSSWPGSTMKSRCFLSAALNCSMWRSSLHVDGATCRGGKGLVCAGADWGQMIYLIKTICQKEQHGNRGGRSPCESGDLLIRCQAKSWTTSLLQPLSNSLLIVYFWITATIKLGGIWLYCVSEPFLKRNRNSLAEVQWKSCL